MAMQNKLSSPELFDWTNNSKDAKWEEYKDQTQLANEAFWDPEDKLKARNGIYYNNYEFLLYYNAPEDETA